MNHVSLIGRITKDIELRYTESGMACVGMFIAVNNGKDKNGNERPADFPKIYVYEKQAENMAKYCHKGSLVGITGRIKTRNWDKEDGSKGYETYVVAGRVEFLDTKPSEKAPLPEPDYKTNCELVMDAVNDPFADFTDEVTNEEMPF